MEATDRCEEKVAVREARLTYYSLGLLSQIKEVSADVPRKNYDTLGMGKLKSYTSLKQILSFADMRRTKQQAMSLLKTCDKRFGKPRIRRSDKNHYGFIIDFLKWDDITGKYGRR